MRNPIKYSILIALLAIFAFSVIARAGCNLATGSYYSLHIEGDISAEDGEICTYTASSAGLSVCTGVWSIDDHEGGCGHHDSCSVIETWSDSESSYAKIQFFWCCVGSNERTVRYQCEEGDDECGIELEVSVDLANPGGEVFHDIDYSWVLECTLATDFITTNYALVGVEDVAVTFFNKNIYVKNESVFLNKVTVHENRHEADVTGGASSPMADYMNTEIFTMLVNTLRNQRYTEEEWEAFRAFLEEDVEIDVSNKMEDNAYGDSESEEPMCGYQRNGRWDI